jgi:hypothetical protein
VFNLVVTPQRISIAEASGSPGAGAAGTATALIAAGRTQPVRKVVNTPAPQCLASLSHIGR